MTPTGSITQFAKLTVLERLEVVILTTKSFNGLALPSSPEYKQQIKHMFNSAGIYDIQQEVIHGTLYTHSILPASDEQLVIALEDLYNFDLIPRVEY